MVDSADEKICFDLPVMLSVAVPNDPSGLCLGSLILLLLFNDISFKCVEIIQFFREYFPADIISFYYYFTEDIINIYDYIQK